MEYHSVHSAPDSRMNRMEYGLLGRDRRRVLLGNFWQEILHGRSHGSSQVTSAMGIPFPERSVLFEIEIPFILLFLNRNKNSLKRMHP